MKKKKNLREQREAKKQERLAACSAKTKAAEIPAAENPAATTPGAEPAKTDSKKKSSVKAAGLKSTLVLDNKLYTTSFGKGNEAVIEQEVNTADYTVANVNSTPSLEIRSAGDKELSFSSHRQFVNKDELSAVNPLYGGKDKPRKPAGKDMLGLKDKLEERYFGKSFNDNIHIQIIYNILDIEKILAVYATNITVALNHMIDKDDHELIGSDFIGYMNTLNTYEVFMEPSKNPKLSDKDRNNIRSSREKFEKLLSTNRLGYFGFDYNAKDRNEELKKRLYHLVAFAGQLRQWSFHGNDTKINPQTWLYQLENTPDLDNEYRDTLDHFFDERFNEINEHFVTQNATNLCIMKEVFPDEDFKSIADLYYDFIVVKSYKNIGFSIKKLREKMLELPEAKRVTSTEMDSVRSKLYKLIDFCIFKHYHEKPETVEMIVSMLRAYTSEDMKEGFYDAEAKRLWSEYGDMFLSFCDNINRWVTGEYADEIVRYIDKDAYKSKRSVSYFSKLLYAMCFFLDGKEINDLLTTLINKFDNIASFIETAKRLGLDVGFEKNYAFFNKSREYVDELNIVKNISRMRKPSEKAKKELYRDALTILGTKDDMEEKALDEELDKILEKQIDPVTGKAEKGKNPFRNFIANNVIENRRFIYVIKFCNPENVRKLVNNTEVTKFVLKRMPETQIDRYFESCVEGELNPTTAKKIEKLAAMMKDMNFEEFRHVRQKVRENSPEAAEKERFKAVIGLYLTVVYLLIKNLVNVNARYVMAFHILERDAKLYGVSLKNGTYDDYLALTEKLVDEGENSRSLYLARNKHMRDCVKQDLANARSLRVYSYRNNIAHLTAVRNCAGFIGDITKIDSYFALYHYLMQRQLAVGLDPKRSGFERNYPYFAKLFEWHTYVKDMVKALNAPFGYNISRFKNLSIDDLFDMNEERVKDAKA